MMRGLPLKEQAKANLAKARSMRKTSVPMLNHRQELFATLVVGGQTRREAYISAGYHCNNSQTLSVCASNLARHPLVMARMKELRDLQAERVIAQVTGIAEVQERKQAMTSKLRAAAETPLTHRDQIAAVHELNLMERVYDERPTITDNRTINIIVSSEKAKELTNNIANRLLELGSNDEE